MEELLHEPRQAALLIAAVMWLVLMRPSAGTGGLPSFALC